MEMVTLSNDIPSPFAFLCFPSSVLSLDPVIGAISAGNAVVLKPSEVAPATSSLLANLLKNYLDNSAIIVTKTHLT